MPSLLNVDFFSLPQVAKILTAKFFLLDLFWKAPELLRNPNAPIQGTQEGDIYAFAIILFEMIGRKGPYGGVNLEPKG